MDDLSQTEPLCRMETALIIIYKERTPRIKPDQSLAGGPIFLTHFDLAYLSRIDDPIHIAIQASLGCFDLYS